MTSSLRPDRALEVLGGDGDRSAIEPSGSSMLLAFDGFVAAAAGASPRGIALVEDAIDRAIASIDQEILELDPDSFGVEAFIPLAAFGTTTRSPEIAVHHTRAHSVIAATLVGVREDLLHFKDACELARRDMEAVDESLVFDLLRYQAALEGIGQGLTGLAGTAYEQAVEEAAELDIEDATADPSDELADEPAGEPAAGDPTTTATTTETTEEA